jgi:hypothetical protein
LATPGHQHHRKENNPDGRIGFDEELRSALKLIATLDGVKGG